MLQEDDEDDEEDDEVNNEVNDDDDDAMPSQQVPTDLGQEQTEDLGKVIYRLLVVCYFVLLPSYFWYRWLYTIEWDVPYRMYYQTTICVAEMFGAICVMMLAVIRFPQPWAYNQAPPKVVPRIKPRYVVHCCVPCYNEPSDLVFATCEAALQLKHEWAKVYVYMLDDGRSLEREKKCMETVVAADAETDGDIIVATPTETARQARGGAAQLCEHEDCAQMARVKQALDLCAVERLGGSLQQGDRLRLRIGLVAEQCAGGCMGRLGAQRQHAVRRATEPQRIQVERVVAGAVPHPIQLRIHTP